MSLFEIILLPKHDPNTIRYFFKNFEKLIFLLEKQLLNAIQGLGMQSYMIVAEISIENTQNIPQFIWSIYPINQIGLYWEKAHTYLSSLVRGVNRAT